MSSIIVALAARSATISSKAQGGGSLMSLAPNLVKS
jgi:hypothetical protein